MRLVSILGYDLLFQYRHGFYHAYFLVTLFYIIILRLLPDSGGEFFAPILIFSDPAVLGCFFIGGMVLLEREQKIYDSFFVTPYKFREFILIRVFSLTVLATIAGIVIILGAFGWRVDFFFYVLGLIFSSVFFTLLGFILAVRARNLNSYLLSASIYCSVFMLPLLYFLDIFLWPVFYFLPSMGSLFLIGAPFRGISTGEIIYSLSILTLGIFFAWNLTQKYFYKHIVQNGEVK